MRGPPLIHTEAEAALAIDADAHEPIDRKQRPDGPPVLLIRSQSGGDLRLRQLHTHRRIGRRGVSVARAAVRRVRHSRRPALARHPCTPPSHATLARHPRTPPSHATLARHAPRPTRPRPSPGRPPRLRERGRTARAHLRLAVLVSTDVPERLLLRQVEAQLRERLAHVVVVHRQRVPALPDPLRDAQGDLPIEGVVAERLRQAALRPTESLDTDDGGVGRYDEMLALVALK